MSGDRAEARLGIMPGEELSQGIAEIQEVEAIDDLVSSYGPQVQATVYFAAYRVIDAVVEDTGLNRLNSAEFLKKLGSGPQLLEPVPEWFGSAIPEEIQTPVYEALDSLINYCYDKKAAASKAMPGRAGALEKDITDIAQHFKRKFLDYSKDNPEKFRDTPLETDVQE